MVGRKAWLFAGSIRGGEAAAVAFSLIESTKLNGIGPFADLKDILTRQRSHRIDRLTELLPFDWKPVALPLPFHSSAIPAAVHRRMD